jgi:putative flippase GtrA
MNFLMDFLQRFFSRLTKYSASGVSTYILDLAIVASLMFFGINYNIAIAIGYIIAISLNYFICHRMVYFGTDRSFWPGYLIFMSLAMVGMAMILGFVHLLIYLTGWDVLIVRTIAAIVIGFFGFLINTFFNFKLL